MPNIALKWNKTTDFADMSLEGSDLKTGDDLVSAAILSLFTWRRANPDDILPDDYASKQGWWGDTFSSVENDKIGSRLWLYRRKKITAQVIIELIEVCEEALKWFVDDKVALKIDVELKRFGLDGVAGPIRIFKHDGSLEVLQFSDIWRALNA